MASQVSTSYFMEPTNLTSPANDLEAPSTSALIDGALNTDGVTVAMLSRRMDRTHSTVRAYLNNDTIQTAVLWKICHALKRNLFADMAAQLPADYRSESMEALRAELETVKKERDLLMRAISGRG